MEGVGVHFICLFVSLSWAVVTINLRDVCQADDGILHCDGQGPGEYHYSIRDESLVRLIFRGPVDGLLHLGNLPSLVAIDMTDSTLTCQNIVGMDHLITIYSTPNMVHYCQPHTTSPSDNTDVNSHGPTSGMQPEMSVTSTARPESTRPEPVTDTIIKPRGSAGPEPVTDSSARPEPVTGNTVSTVKPWSSARHETGEAHIMGESTSTTVILIILISITTFIASIISIINIVKCIRRRRQQSRQTSLELDSFRFRQHSFLSNRSRSADSSVVEFDADLIIIIISSAITWTFYKLSDLILELLIILHDQIIEHVRGLRNERQLPPTRRYPLRIRRQPETLRYN